MSTFVVVDYDPSWPIEFERTAAEIHRLFDFAVSLRIEHVGSTSVPGLIAKPIIDIVLGATTLQAVATRAQALATIGFRHVTDHDDALPNRRYHVRDASQRLRANLHAVVLDSPLWRNHIAFRDALRQDPALAQEYAALKRELAKRHARDRPAYTAAKGPFIQNVLARLEPTRD
jgi:GrpB-like predicted nucleotidyltransferase (UPF0157 family)